MSQLDLDARLATASVRNVSQATRHWRKQALLAQMQDQRKDWLAAISERKAASASPCGAIGQATLGRNWLDLNAVDWFNLARKHPWGAVASLGLAYAIGPKRIFNFAKFLGPYLCNRK